jgi:hypothetical protein
VPAAGAYCRIGGVVVTGGCLITVPGPRIGRGGLKTVAGGGVVVWVCDGGAVNVGGSETAVGAGRTGKTCVVVRVPGAVGAL